jgi:hypothetical protein
MTLAEAMTVVVNAMLRDETDRIESAITAAVHAHLPVSHVAYHNGSDGGDYVRRWDVVLPGGVVFASGGIRVPEYAW